MAAIVTPQIISLKKNDCENKQNVMRLVENTCWE